MATDYTATCATCAHRDADGMCRETRSAWHGWDVARKKGDCYFYNRRPTTLPRFGGLAEPEEEESDATA